MSKKKVNIIKFPLENGDNFRKVEAILFAAEEPLDEETINFRLKKNININKILITLQQQYSKRGVNLVKIKNKWSFRTAEDLSK